MSAASISCPEFLLIRSGAALVILGLLGFLPDHPQRLLQKRSGFLAVRPFESHSVNLDFARGPDDDFDSSVRDILRAHEHEFYGPVLLLPAKNGQPPLIFDLIPRPNGWLPSAAPVGSTVPSSPGRTRRKSDGRHLRVGPAVVDPDATWEYSKRVRQCGSGGPQ